MILEIFLSLLCTGLIIELIRQRRNSNKQLQELTKAIAESKVDNAKILSQKKSSEVITGHIAENLAPLLEDFKWDPRKVRFLGMPIDYIYFGEDKIVFIEIKSGGAKLTKKESEIKELIRTKKVYFETFRISGDKKKDGIDIDNSPID